MEYGLQHLLRRRKDVPRAPVGGFHHQGAGMHRFAAFGAPALPELKISGVEQGIPIDLQAGHGTAQDMPRWMQAEAERRLGRRRLQIGVIETLVEFEHPLRSGSGNP